MGDINSACKIIIRTKKFVVMCSISHVSFIRKFLSAVAIAANSNRQRVDGAQTTANRSVGLVSRGRFLSDWFYSHSGSAAAVTSWSGDMLVVKSH